MHVGLPLTDDVMYLTRGRDFLWGMQLVDKEGRPHDFPAGRLFFEVGSAVWECRIEGSHAYLKVESDIADGVQNRTRWQLVFLPEGEAAGGLPVARGYVKVQK